MKKTCAAWLVVYAVVAVAVSAIVYRRFPILEAAIPAGAVGSVVVTLGLAYLAGIRTRIAEGAMIRRGRKGEPPRDGEKVAAIGRINASGPTLTSPLSRTACVAYKYEIRIRSGMRNASDVKLYDGFALTKNTIHTADRRIQLLTMPELKVAREVVPREMALRNAKEYLRSAPVREASIAGSWKDLMEMYKDMSGTTRNDQKAFGADPSMLDSATSCSEWLIRSGESVCAIGFYSAKEGGIIPNPDNAFDRPTIEKGEPEKFGRIGGVLGYLLGGAICLGAAAVVLLGFFAIVPLAASEQMSPNMTATWPEIRLEHFLDRKVRPRMRERGWLDSGIVIPQVPLGAARGRMRTASGDVSLVRASAATSGDQTIVHLDDAVVLTFDRKGNPPRVTVAGVVIDDADVELVSSGEDEVIGRLTAIAPGGTPAAHATFRAAKKK